MASKNTIKIDVEDGYYHIYNRGVGKMVIFKDEEDFGVFLSYLKESLSPASSKDDLMQKIYIQDRVLYAPSRVPKNFYGKIKLLCYCLMPNHIHLIIKQLEKSAMKNFVHSILIRYSMYFNKKYNRVGPLFQGRYKAALIDTDIYLLYLSKYIHLNPRELNSNLVDAKSSYADYLGLKHTPWIDSKIILSFFNKKLYLEFVKTNTYKRFVENNGNDCEIIQSLTLER
jgi:putative transposase